MWYEHIYKTSTIGENLVMASVPVIGPEFLMDEDTTTEFSPHLPKEIPLVMDRVLNYNEDEINKIGGGGLVGCRSPNA